MRKPLLAMSLLASPVVAATHAVVSVSGDRLLVTSGGDAGVRFLTAGDAWEPERLTVGRKPHAAVLPANGCTADVMNADDALGRVARAAAAQRR